MKDVAVIIVNYRTPELVKQCVASVLSQQDVDFEVIVVDNDSQDESLAVLRSLEPAISVVANAENLGFGTACNQGAKRANARYYYFLNPDAELKTNTDLAQLVQYMDAHAACGLVGTGIENSQGELEVTAWDHYPRQDKSGVDFSTLPGDIATVLGASMFVRREAFAAVDGFDQDYFLYAEETDLCLRLRQAGFMIAYLPSIVVSHVGGASEASAVKADVVRRKKSAKYLFYRKHYTQAGLRSIAQSDFKRARSNLFKLKFRKLFGGLNAKQQAKLARHQVVYDLAKACLQQL